MGRKKAEGLHDGHHIAAKVLADLFWFPEGPRRVGAIMKAAEEAKVTQKTVHLWVKIPEFIELVDKYRQDFKKLVISSMQRQIEQGVPATTIFVAKNLMHDDFDDQLRRDREKREHELYLRKIVQEEMEKAVQELPKPVFADHVNGHSHEMPDSLREYFDENTELN